MRSCGGLHLVEAFIWRTSEASYSAFLTHKLLTYDYDSFCSYVVVSCHLLLYYFCQNSLNMTSQEDFPTSRSVYFPACWLQELCNGFCVRAGLDCGRRCAPVTREFQPKTRLFKVTTGKLIIIINVSRWSVVEVKFLVRGVWGWLRNLTSGETPLVKELLA